MNQPFPQNARDQVLHELAKSLLCSVEFKSMALFYSHDLENRTFKFACEAPYKLENCQFEKDYLYNLLYPVSDLLFKQVFELKETEEIKKLLRFFFYLDNKNFFELFTLLLVSFPDKYLNSWFSKSPDFLSSRRSVLQDEFLMREVKTIRKIFGLL